MDIYEIVSQIHNKAVLFKVLLTLSSKERDLLSMNQRFKNIHRGERCFILGNGPSIRNDNLHSLKGECIITVNQAFRNKKILELHPRYHFWVDQNFFKIDSSNEEDVELLDCMTNTSTSSDYINCFYPIEQHGFVKQHGLYIPNRTFFLYPKLLIDSCKRFNADISKTTYSFGTVIQNAIVSAIYMGFDEIILLGCDSTGIINTLNAAMKIDNNDYGYKVSENEKIRMEKMVERSKITDYAYSYYMTLKGFTFLNQVCENNGIKLINCSNQTVLDMIPRLSLKDVI